MKTASPIPARLIVTFALLVGGGYALGVGEALGWYGHYWTLLAMTSWYAMAAADGLLVVMGAPPGGWPRWLAAGLAGVCLICAVAGAIHPQPRWLLVAFMAACALPAGLHAITGRYPGRLRQPR